MISQVKVSSAWKTVAAKSVRVGGAWKAVAQEWTKVGGVWKESGYTAPAVEVDTSYVFGIKTGSGTCTSDAATITASGGSGSFTYAWSRVSGDSSTSATSPTAAASTFHRTGSPTNNYSSVWRCRVTDTVSSLYTDSEDVTCELSFEP